MFPEERTFVPPQTSGGSAHSSPADVKEGLQNSSYIGMVAACEEETGIGETQSAVHPSCVYLTCPLKGESLSVLTNV